MTRALALLAVAGCAASEVMVHVDTDAPVAPALAADTPWLFDRLRIDVLRGGQPLEPPAARDFALTDEMFRQGRVSMGVGPSPHDREVTVRVRLYRSGRLLAGEPRPSSTLDTTIALPPVGDNQQIDVTVRLRTEDVGKPQGPMPAERGLPGPSQVGTWPGAAVVPCHDQPGPGEVCVPGGAFWMGDPLLGNLGMGLEADAERLVVVSPFFLDVHEVTVGDYRPVEAVIGDPPDAPPPDMVLTDQRTWCTWSESPGEREPLPLNCLRHPTAARYCQLLNKELPTEAQFEFAASGRGRELGYVWGADDPTCPDCVFGRGGIGLFSTLDPECRPIASIGSPLPSGSGARDRVRMPGASEDVVDLAGNVSEYLRDKWSRQDEAFWSRPGVYRDPVADLDSPKDGRDLGTYATRGGYFVALTLELRAAFRGYVNADSASPTTGFRCARADR
jgi:formylglycine-generating enzyme required for sulfatase activity